MPPVQLQMAAREMPTRLQMREAAAGLPGLVGLAARFDLSPAQTAQLGNFATVLAEDEHAPTTVRDPERVRDDHLADALVAIELPVVRNAGSVADLGAGAGVPGIPLAIALPAAQ